MVLVKGRTYAHRKKLDKVIVEHRINHQAHHVSYITVLAITQEYISLKLILIKLALLLRKLDVLLNDLLLLFHLGFLNADVVDGLFVWSLAQFAAECFEVKLWYIPLSPLALCPR